MKYNCEIAIPTFAKIGNEETNRNLKRPQINFFFRSLLIRNVRELFIRKLVLAVVITENGNAISKFNPKIFIRIEALAAKKLYKETSNVSEARKISVRI